MLHFDINMTQPEPTHGHTPKGDQPKWHIGSQWVKADHMGYEGMSEVIVSSLLGKSNCQAYIQYESAQVLYKGKSLNGCASTNFLNHNEILIPFERLHRLYRGKGLAAVLPHMETPQERIQYTVDLVQDITGLEGVGPWLTEILELDAFFLNEDRHTNNLAVIYNESRNVFRLCPVFDNGLALLSDYNDYPLSTDIYELIPKVTAKPFDRSFDVQAFAAEELYGPQIQFHFGLEDIADVVRRLDSIYDHTATQRIETVLHEQTRKYKLFFPN